MRVAYICTDAGVPVFGNKGCSIHVQEVLRAFQALGAEVMLFATRLGGEAPAGLKNLPTFVLPLPPASSPAHREQLAVALNSSLTKILDQKCPFDLVYERYSLWSFAAMEWARHRQVSSALEVNAPLIREQQKYRVLVDEAAALETTRKAFENSERICCVSEELAGYVRTFGGLESKILVQPNAVDAKRFHPGVPPVDRRSDLFTLGFVGSLKPWHGVETLLESFAIFSSCRPDSRLLIVGDGPGREEIQRSATTSSDLQGRVQLVGQLDSDQIPGWLTSMDVAAAPYPNSGDCYFSPLKVYEYMAAGLPVIASRLGQLEDLIDHGVNGLLCPPGDSRSLAGQLEQLASNPELAARLGQRARCKVAAHHSWTNNVRQILSTLSLGQTSVGRMEAAL